MSDTSNLWRDWLIEVNRAALARRAGSFGREPVRLQCFGVWGTDAVRSAPHSINEVPILANERITLSCANWPTLADIDHDLELG